MRSVGRILEASFCSSGHCWIGLEVAGEVVIAVVLQFCDRDSGLSTDVDSTDSKVVLA